MNLTEIGGRIKAERKRQGMTQEKLAEMINVSPHYIYEIERGMKAMSLETLISITRVLEISADYLIFGSSTHKPDRQAGLFEQLSALSEEKRQRAENAFCALLPYIT